MAVTWNPSDKSNYISLSNDDMTATIDVQTWSSVRATQGVSSGKKYWEVVIDVFYINGDHMVGIAGLSASTATHIGASSVGYGYMAYNGKIYHNGSSSSYGNPYGLNAVIGIALDMDSGKFWISKDNVWQNSGNPVTGANPAASGLSGTFYPALSFYRLNDEDTAHFNSADLVYSPPSGFLPLDYTEPADDKKYLRCTGTSGIKCRMTGSTGKHLIMRGV